MDPLQRKYPFLSAYCGMGNIPTCLIDADGRVIINPYNKDKEGEKESFLKVQRAIEIVKLTLPGLYETYQADPRQITIVINEKLAPSYKEPSVLDGDPGTTTYTSGGESLTHTLGRADHMVGALKLVTKKEVVNGAEVINYFKKVAETNHDGTTMRDENNKIIYKEIPISEEDANKLVSVDPAITINLAKGISSTGLLGQVLSHELGHVDFVATKPALSVADKNLGLDVNEDYAQKKEAEYEKVYDSKNDKKADTKANE